MIGATIPLLAVESPPLACLWHTVACREAPLSASPFSRSAEVRPCDRERWISAPRGAHRSQRGSPPGCRDRACPAVEPLQVRGSYDRSDRVCSRHEFFVAGKTGGRYGHPLEDRARLATLRQYLFSMTRCARRELLRLAHQRYPRTINRCRT